MVVLPSPHWTWTIKFNLHSLPSNTEAVLSVSLAGDSSGVNSSITLNKSTTIGTLSSGQIPSDACLYRSAITAGEWHYSEFPIADGLLKWGWNSIDFTIRQRHGFMFYFRICEREPERECGEVKDHIHVRATNLHRLAVFASTAAEGSGM